MLYKIDVIIKDLSYIGSNSKKSFGLRVNILKFFVEFIMWFLIRIFYIVFRGIDFYGYLV